MRFAISLVLFAACSLAVHAWAAETWIDDFESYTSDPEIQAVWVGSTANVSTHVWTPGFDSIQCLDVDYHMGLDPWWGNVVFSFTTPQDWTSSSRLTLRYMGGFNTEGSYCSGEDLEIQIKNAVGDYFTGPRVQNATKAFEWLEYSMDISGCPFLSEVSTIEIHLVARDYGAGDLYIDRIVVDTFPPKVDDFETYANANELRAAWQTTQNDFIWLNATGSADGEPQNGNQYLRCDYLASFPPYDAKATLTWSKEQDWSAYKSLSLWYRGRDALINAQQDFTVQLKDKEGGWFDGPVVGNATQCTVDPTYCEWQEYIMDIQAWTNRGFAKEISLQILGFPDYGNGRFYVDNIELSENPPVSTDSKSWSGVKAMFR